MEDAHRDLLERVFGARVRDPLDDAYVVRGGEMSSPDLERAADQCFKVKRFYGISVYSQTNKSAQQIADDAALDHSSIRYCTAKDIRLLELEIRKTGGAHHYAIVFPKKPGETEWEKMRTAFCHKERNLSAGTHS